MPLVPKTLTAATITHGAYLSVVYDVEHWTGGPGGTCLSEPLTLDITPSKTTAKLVIEDCEAATPDEALARMAVWLRRLADGIEQRSTSVQIPLC